MHDEKQLKEAYRQFSRNLRWGTCVECPRSDGHEYPEFCTNTKRYDHNLSFEDLAFQTRNYFRDMASIKGEV